MYTMLRSVLALYIVIRVVYSGTRLVVCTKVTSSYLHCYWRWKLSFKIVRSSKMNSKSWSKVWMRDFGNSIVSVFVAYLCDQGMIPALFSNSLHLICSKQEGLLWIWTLWNRSRRNGFQIWLGWIWFNWANCSSFHRFWDRYWLIFKRTSSALRYSVLFPFTSTQILCVYWCNVWEYKIY